MEDSAPVHEMEKGKDCTMEQSPTHVVGPCLLGLLKVHCKFGFSYLCWPHMTAVDICAGANFWWLVGWMTRGNSCGLRM